MKGMIKIVEGVFQVGGGRLSDPDDCCVYLVDGGQVAALIDAGAGRSVPQIMTNITEAGVDLQRVKYIVATHGHIDHIGGLKELQEGLRAEVVAHQLELPAIQAGLPHLTAASWYRVNYRKVHVDVILTKAAEKVQVGDIELHCLHTPGHTPGGISVWIDIEGRRVLFGQDIHGPFNKEWGSDLKQWRVSMQALLDLDADILCEGHFGIIQPAPAVRRYIEGYLGRFK